MNCPKLKYLRKAAERLSNIDPAIALAWQRQGHAVCYGATAPHAAHAIKRKLCRPLVAVGSGDSLFHGNSTKLKKDDK